MRSALDAACAGSARCDHALVAEVVDWRRFAAARAFMGFAGLTPAEYSSGFRTRRGHITKAGPQGVRTALAEAARAYRYRPAIGVTLPAADAGPLVEGAAAAARASLLPVSRRSPGTG